jgi:two-component system, chemotaxis family, protein-glutamate methylesterase/glutaminase
LASSAGGLHALQTVVAGLPNRFPAAVTVLLHLDRNHPSHLVEILQKQTELQVRQAAEGEPIEAGVIYVAGPNRHLLIEPGPIARLTDTELVRYVRPSADLLFESIASTYGQKAIAVVMTGTGLDGAEGIVAIRKSGGTVIIEDPETAAFDGMPAAALATGAVDFVVQLEEIAEKVKNLVIGHDE